MKNWFAREGSPSPLGVTWIEDEAAYNFALYSKHATAVSLLLYSEIDIATPTYEHRLDPLAKAQSRMPGTMVIRSQGRTRPNKATASTRRGFCWIHMPGVSAFLAASAVRRRRNPVRMPAEHRSDLSQPNPGMRGAGTKCLSIPPISSFMSCMFGALRNERILAYRRSIAAHFLVWSRRFPT